MIYVPSLTEQNKAIANIKQFLESMAGLQNRPGLTSISELILTYGKAWYMNDASFVGKRKTAKECFANSYRLATIDSSLTYVEGYVHIGIMPIEHAWVIDHEGFVIDPTLPAPDPTKRINPTGYFGIPFKEDYVQKVALRSGVYGILGMNRELVTGQDKPDDFLATI